MFSSLQVHSHYPGMEILQATLTKYRKKTLLLEMVNAALDFDVDYENLEKLCSFPKGTVCGQCGNT